MEEEPQPQGTPLYRVTDILSETIYDGKGPGVPGFRVHFDVLGKNGFNVAIPESDFDPQRAEMAVRDVAARVAAALTIEGQPIQLDLSGRPVAPESA